MKLLTKLLTATSALALLATPALADFSSFTPTMQEQAAAQYNRANGFIQANSFEALPKVLQEDVCLIASKFAATNSTYDLKQWLLYQGASQRLNDALVNIYVTVKRLDACSSKD